MMVSSSQAEWKASKTPGVWIKMLRRDADTEASTFLVRLEPGAKIPAHDHPAGEEIFVTEGDVRIGGERLHAGDYLYTPPSVKHAAASEHGCVFLVTLPKPVVILKD